MDEGVKGKDNKGKGIDEGTKGKDNKGKGIDEGTKGKDNKGKGNWQILMAVRPPRANFDNTQAVHPTTEG